MKRIALSLALVTVITATSVKAQNNQALSLSVANEALNVAAGDALLTVTADGKSSRTPDIATFTAGINNVGKTASAAVAANAAAMTRVIAALRAAGVADRDVQTSNVSLNPVFDSSDQNHPRINGYQALNNVLVRARAISAMGQIIDTLVNAGANEVSGPNFDLDHPEAALDEARTNAMAAAHSRADLYAHSTGLKVLRILSISEIGGNPPRAMRMTTVAIRGSAAPTPVAVGEVGVDVNVTVQFELAPQ